MSWKVVIAGQAMSQNHAYVPVFRTDRRGRSFRARALSKDAQRYFDDAVWLIKKAMPRGWSPEGQVRVYFDLYLTRNVDCDNAMKLISDALEAATGINDSRFLHCTRSKTTRLPLSGARIEIEVDDLSPSPSQVPAA